MAKEALRGKQFQDDDDAISAVEDFPNSQNETFYDQGIQQLMNASLGKMCGLAGGICREGLTHIQFLAPVSLFSQGEFCMLEAL
jgi:hypothetical protein